MRKKPIILLDPGHGGENEGCTVGPTMLEKDMTLEIAMELKASLLSLPVQVECTRYDDIYLSKTDRNDMAKKLNPAFVLSIHVNSMGPSEKRFHGADMFYWYANRRGKKIAEACAKAMPKQLHTGRIHGLGPNNKLDWQDTYAVVRAFDATAVLAECGFGSDPQDSDFILNPWGRSQVVSALRAGACRGVQMLSAG